MDHHITGFLQFRNDTIRTEEKNDRIEMAAIQDDGVVTKEEKKQIKKIKKAIRAFSLSLKYEVRAHDVIRGLAQITDIGFAYTLRRDDGHFSGVGYDPRVKGACYMNRHGDP